MEWNSEPFTRYQVACIYALGSQRDESDRQRALQLLAQALRANPELWELAESDPDVDLLRDDPECRRILDAARQLQADESTVRRLSDSSSLDP